MMNWLRLYEFLHTEIHKDHRYLYLPRSYPQTRYVSDPQLHPDHRTKGANLQPRIWPKTLHELGRAKSSARPTDKALRPLRPH